MDDFGSFFEMALECTHDVCMSIVVIQPLKKKLKPIKPFYYRFVIKHQPVYKSLHWVRPQPMASPLGA